VQLLEGLRVLVVDDNRVNRDVAREILERHGADAAECENAEAALEAVRVTRPDAVLLDIHMPGMDGWGAAHQLRGLVDTPIPVIVVSTARNERGDAALAEAGIVAWLLKPLHEASLVTALRYWTGRGPMPIPASGAQKPAPENLSTALAALKPEIRVMLQEDLPEDQRVAYQIFSEKQWAVLQAHIHRLHGTASFCHLEALRVLCAGIERGLKEQQPPDADRIRQLDEEIGRILAALLESPVKSP
jgi:two-component system sensor histidine kinase BarA